jgi:hypothetical protein
MVLHPRNCRIPPLQASAAPLQTLNSLAEWATELRLLGNEGAHPEIDQIEANPQDIRDAIEFLDVLLHYLYDLPAQIKQYRERRGEQH